MNFDPHKTLDTILEREKLRGGINVLISRFSPDGRYLLCGNNRGMICVWDVLGDQYANGGTSIAKEYPKRAWRAHDGAVYSLAFCSVGPDNSQLFLFSGGDDRIRGWRWDKIVESFEVSDTSAVQHVMEFRVDENDTRSQGGARLCPETNSLYFNPVNNVLYCGCGDNKAYGYDLEHEQCVATFSGHTDYIHSVRALTKSGQLVTGSEDGTVRFWDLKSTKQIDLLHPFAPKSASASSNNHPWVSCVAVDETENFMVCGGGVRYLTMWHAPTRKMTAVLPTSASTYDATFVNDKIISGGNEKRLYYWRANGTLATTFEINTSCVYSLGTNASCIPTAATSQQQQQQQDAMDNDTTTTTTATIGPLPPLIAVTGRGAIIELYGESQRVKSLEFPLQL